MGADLTCRCKTRMRLKKFANDPVVQVTLAGNLKSPRSMQNNWIENFGIYDLKMGNRKFGSPGAVEPCPADCALSCAQNWGMLLSHELAKKLPSCRPREHFNPDKFVGRLIGDRVMSKN